MALDVVSQVNLLTDKLANQAVGQLYDELGFINQTNKWSTQTEIENGGSFNIPLLGDFASNTRAPGADVVDQTPNPTRRNIPVVEEETSFLVDPTWAASEGSIKFLTQQIEGAINALAQAVMIDVLEIIALSAGLASQGALGVTLTKAVFDGSSQALTDESIPRSPRIAILSTAMMTDALNISEYSNFDQSGVAGQNPNGRVMMAAGFQLLDSPYVHSPAANQHVGFACWPQSIWTVFPMQKTFNKGEVAVKTEMEKDGMRLYLLREYSEKKNGAERWTFSVRYGARVGRDEGVILINGD